MTTGTYVKGSETSSFFASKSWSGTNGKFSDPLTKKHVQWNNYTMTARFGNATPGKGTTWQNQLYTGYIWGPQNVNWTSNDTLQILSQLSAAVKGHSFNLGVALGEGRETISLVVGTLTRFTSAVRQLKRGRIDLAVRSLGALPRGTHKRTSLQGPRGRRILKPKELVSKDISSMWLEIQYGWRPLISDVYESQKAFVKLTEKPRTSFLKVHYKKDWPIYASGNSYGKWRVVSSTSRQIRCVMTENLPAARSLGLENPLSIAWELVPFSFVADWFIPIGTYLEAYNAIPAINGAFLTTERTISSTHVVGLSAPYLNATSIGKTISLTRTGSSSLLVPRPQFNDVETSLSLGRIKNAIALFHQVVL